MTGALRSLAAPVDGMEMGGPLSSAKPARETPVGYFHQGPVATRWCAGEPRGVCRARRRATELPASHELCLLELPAIARQIRARAANRARPGCHHGPGPVHQRGSSPVAAARRRQAAGAARLPASRRPDDVAGNAVAAVDQLLESFERVLAAVVDGRLPGFGFENDAASTSLKALVKRLDEADDASTALEDVIKTLNTADISADEVRAFKEDQGRAYQEHLGMWEGGKLFLRAGKPSDDEAAAALDRVELRRDVFVAVVDAIKAHVDEKHGSIGSHGVSFGEESDWVIRLRNVAQGKVLEKYWICGESTTLASVSALLALVRECGGAARAAGESLQQRLAVPRLSLNSTMARCGTCKLATDVAPRDLDEALGPITFKTCGATNLTKQGDREAPVLKFAAPEAPAGGGADARAVRRGTGFTLKFRSRAAGLCPDGNPPPLPRRAKKDHLEPINK